MNVACYADDAKLFRRVATIEDCTALQSDLTNAVGWSESSGLLFNRSKCKCQHLTRKLNPVKYTYSIRDTYLESCDLERDIGVWISSDLKWTKQVTEKSTRANKLLGFIHRSSRDILNTSTRRTLYLAIVRGMKDRPIGPLKQIERV